MYVYIYVQRYTVSCKTKIDYFRIHHSITAEKFITLHHIILTSQHEQKIVLTNYSTTKRLPIANTTDNKLEIFLEHGINRKYSHITHQMIIFLLHTNTSKIIFLPHSTPHTEDNPTLHHEQETDLILYWSMTIYVDIW